MPLISLFTMCYLLVKHNLLFPASPKTRQDLSLRPVVCFPWSCGSQLLSGSDTIKMAAFPATKLCPAALTNPGIEPCRCDLDAAQPAWGMAEKIQDCSGLPGCHTPPLWLYMQSMEGNDSETMFSTQNSLVNITKSCCRLQQCYHCVVDDHHLPPGVTWNMEAYMRSSPALSISTTSRDKWVV